MRKVVLLPLLFAVLAITGDSQMQIVNEETSPARSAKIQVVFALDATGSMSGLISAAKDKIWSIVSSLTQAETQPDIEIGLVFYRDRGDDFVTRRIPLSDSIDMVYGELMKIEARGGGDGPESVNQGLNEAVEQFQWDTDTSTYKAVFLVGDFEPHMNYKNDVPYYVTCRIAKSRDIILNTILMGNNTVAERVWKEIAACNEGAFVNVNMNVNDIQVPTPYDTTIARLNDQLDELRYYYGKAEVKAAGLAYKSKSKLVTDGSKAGVKAQRAEYNSYYFSKKSSVKQNELLSDLASNQVNLDSLKQSDLPDEFKYVSRDSLATLLKQKAAQREELQKQLRTQISNRNSYLESELSKRSSHEVQGSFNNVIFSNIKKQTEKKKIILKGKAKF